VSQRRPIVLVTGSEGLVGRPTCRRLIQAGCEVYGFDRNRLPESLVQHSSMHRVACDLTDDKSVKDSVRNVIEQEGWIDSVVHLAAYHDFSGKESLAYQRVTVEGTQRLLLALDPYRVDQFVFSSTMLVHKPVEIGEQIEESSPQLARWPYPQSKIDTERLIREDYPQVRSVFLRLAGVYTDWGIQPTLVEQIKRMYEKDFQAHFFPGNMQAGQSSVHLEDAVDSIVKTVERRDQLETAVPILIGESEPPSYGELQDYIGRAIHGDGWTTLYVPPALARAGATVMNRLFDGETFAKPFMVDLADKHYALNISRAAELLQWRPQHKLRNVLPKIIRNLLNEPAEWYAKNGISQPQEV
jgi:nucleoside-diphosphate-sugar epimerase